MDTNFKLSPIIFYFTNKENIKLYIWTKQEIPCERSELFWFTEKFLNITDALGLNCEIFQREINRCDNPVVRKRGHEKYGRNATKNRWNSIFKSYYVCKDPTNEVGWMKSSVSGERIECDFPQYIRPLSEIFRTKIFPWQFHPIVSLFPQASLIMMILLNVYHKYNSFRMRSSNSCKLEVYR